MGMVGQDEGREEKKVSVGTAGGQVRRAGQRQREAQQQHSGQGAQGAPRCSITHSGAPPPCWQGLQTRTQAGPALPAPSPVPWQSAPLLRRSKGRQTHNTHTHTQQFSPLTSSMAKCVSSGPKPRNALLYLPCSALEGVGEGRQGTPGWLSAAHVYTAFATAHWAELLCCPRIYSRACKQILRQLCKAVQRCTALPRGCRGTAAASCQSSPGSTCAGAAGGRQGSEGGSAQGRSLETEVEPSTRVHVHLPLRAQGCH